MSYTTWKFVHKAKDGTETEVTEAFDPVVTKSLGEGRDTFQIKLNNTQGTYDNFFKPSEKLLVYRDTNTATATSLVMNGIIQDTPEDRDDKQELIRVKGADYSDIVLGAIVFLDATNLKTDEALTQVIRSIQAINPNFPVTEASGNPSAKSDNTDFPVVGRKYYYKPASQVIEELLKPEFTGDGLYYWYVNKDNEFVWGRRDNTLSASFNADTDNYYTLDIGKDTKGIKNYIIVKGGQDPRGNPIQTRYFDSASMTKHGAKYDIISDDTRFAQDIVSDDRAKAGVDDMTSATFPFTPTWTSTEYASYGDYVDGVVDHVKEFLKEKARNYIASRKYGKLELTISFPVGKQWSLGSLIECTVPQFGSAPKKLRVERVRLSPTEETYTLVEDIGSV